MPGTRIGGDDRCEDDGFAEGDGDGTVGLLGEEAGFDFEGFAVDDACNIDN